MDSINICAYEVVIEVNAEGQNKCSQNKANGISSKNKLDLVLSLPDISIADGLEATWYVNDIVVLVDLLLFLFVFFI